jgi:hypothetical protein
VVRAAPDYNRLLAAHPDRVFQDFTKAERALIQKCVDFSKKFFGIVGGLRVSVYPPPNRWRNGGYGG